ncbi:hypothetical protein SEA_ROSMARINUS_88 [Mycobacterium Phage Rosmarinus]|nr:hypothetical protein SEA_CREW_87 [Mycobacterium phage CREW]ASR86920.1 hypothetical protein SEA_JECKYLL_88 [Mycobacterium phage Jeckyll]ASR87691.1 hypothetical protein SEA_TACHEZ_88 [Mycobacterium phage Tachez]AXH47118.1 hypothetical protein SEA_BEEST_88 [Mycobacterium phage BEEST]AXH50056.1 hypothetical protein SEA_HOMURA_87 [Mycobacterium phage Homura]AXH50150.1 hypothetical protein SEA_JOY99_89 [Mycobacterium phage Joy99]AXQ51605.1 hypothetical protein SEA_BELLADONNA_88 [Mycobacterium ph
MGSSPVMFLDGPLAGTTREVQTWPNGELAPYFNVATPPKFDPTEMLRDPRDMLRPETHTYRIKCNRLSYGPQWVGAIGDKVGEQIVTVLPYDERARQSVGVDEFEEYITRNAYQSAQRHAQGEGLVAVEVHEVWRGTQAEAREQMVREGKPVKGAPVFLDADGPVFLDSTVFVVHEAVAVPKDQAREVIL